MKKILNFLCAIVLFFGFTAGVHAVDKTITFTSSTTFSNNANIRFDNAGSTYKTAKLGNGTTVMAYCFNHQLEAPLPGSKLTLRSLTANEQSKINSFIYILNNGWNGSTWNRSGNFTNEEKYYITQLTIWGLQGTDGGGIDLSKLNANTTKKTSLKNAAVKFLADAKANSKQEPVTLGLAPTTANLTLSSDKKYYVTSNFKVTGTGYSKYKVTLDGAPTGTDIYVPLNNVTKKSGDTINAGKEFYVRVPVSKVTKDISFTVKVDIAGTVQELYIYEFNKTVQDIGVPVTKTVSLAKSATIKAEVRGGLSVKKVSINAAGEESDLKDVTITVTNSSGAVVAKWNTSSENPKVINNLPLGTYTVHEESAPAGYTKSDDVKVTVKANSVVEVKLQNTKDRKPIYISKQDATTGTELPGAHLVLKDALGNLVEEWTSTNTPHLVSKQLTPGKYVLSETIAPEGYQKTTETVSFIVNNDGGVDTPVIMKNKPVTSVKISKQDITTKKELPGAKLAVKDANGNVVDEWVSTTTPHYLPEDLPAGKYTLIERIAPEGYGLSEEIVEFEITNDGIEKTVVMTNSPIPVTADIPVPLIVVGAVAAVGLALFSMFKVGKQEA